MSNALVKTNYPQVKELFASQDAQTELMRSLQSVVKVDQLTRVALTVIRRNDTLMECHKISLMACLFACAQLALTPEPFLGQAYFVPYWNNKPNPSVREAQFMPGYRGYIALARRSGELANLSAQMRYKNDDFEMEWGLDEKLVHKPAAGDRGDHVGAWTVFRYSDPGAIPTFDYMTIEDIEAIRLRSKSPNKGPWKTDYAEMAKKTVIRRHMKLAPLSVEDTRLAVAAESENRYLIGHDQKDLFLPESKPLEIGTGPERESGPATNGNGVDPVEVFEIEFPPGDHLVNEYLSICATASKTTVDDLKMQVANSPDTIAAFRRAFESWKQDPARDPKPPGKKPASGPPAATADTNAAFYAEWKNLREKGFGPFVNKNLDRFVALAPMSDYDVKAREKWQQYYSEYTYPVDEARKAASNGANGVGSSGNGSGVDSGESDEVDSVEKKLKADSGRPATIRPEVWSDLQDCFNARADLFVRALKTVTGGTLPESEIQAMDIISRVDQAIDQANG